MWVFGYGSLMWDDWCGDLPCTNKAIGVLRGYRRAFNKKSVLNWGTKDLPGPTLNLVADAKASCRGALFEFPCDSKSEVMNVLTDREGRNFAFPTKNVRFGICRTVSAVVPIYTGRNVIETATQDQIVDMICSARGEKGSCRDYVLNLAKHMRSSGIHDAIVEGTVEMLKRRDAQQVESTVPSEAARDAASDVR